MLSSASTIPPALRSGHDSSGHLHSMGLVGSRSILLEYMWPVSRSAPCLVRPALGAVMLSSASTIPPAPSCGPDNSGHPHSMRLLGSRSILPGVYVAGQTRGTLPGQTSSGGRDAFVRKYDSAGTEVWTRQFGTFAVDQASGVSVDSSGVYVAGFTGGTLPGQSSAGFTDAFVRKYDLAGTEVWTRQFGSPSLDEARGVSVDSSGVYVAGQTRSTLPGQTSAGSIDAFVVKLRGDNTPPTANAGLDQTVEWTGDPVILNGVQSSDPDPGDTLTFSWSFSSLPVGSIATLTSAASANPSFTR